MSAPSGDWPASLLPHHRELLAARAITPAVAAARGYSSTTLTRWLHDDAGFSHAVAALVPGLVIPVRDFTGQIRFHQYRPDHPRDDAKGRPVKYETPARTRLVVDIPAQACARVRSGGPPLWLTESPMKADAAVSAGMTAAAVLGVWGWKGPNRRGGRTALPDWDEIDLDGREVYLAPDSDVATNRKVLEAVTRLGGILAARGADVRYVVLPPGGDGSKQGLDDWLARNGPDVAALLTLAADTPPDAPPSAPRASASTESGHAARLVAEHGDMIRYVADSGRWLVWDGRRWEDDVRQRVYDMARRVAHDVTVATAKAGGDFAALRAAKSHERWNAVRGVVALAATDPRVVLVSADLDADHDLVNCRNGTVHWPTGKLRAHRPADLITRLAPAEFNPGARHAAWDAHLERTHADPGVRALLARLFGLAMWGRTPEHILPVHVGNGANGKSTFYEAVLAAFGDYAVTLPAALLTLDPHGSEPPERLKVALQGRRLAIVSESGRGQRLAEPALKALTGGDRVSAHRLYREQHEFDPSHTLMMFTNHRPKVTGNDDGVWRRLIPFLWLAHITDAEMDSGLKDRLKAEAGPAILAWAHAGFLDYLDGGLALPAPMAGARRQWRETVDVVARFLARCCVVGPGERATSAELWETWQRWAETCAPPVPAGTRKRFGQEIAARFELRRTAAGNTYDGVGLAASWAEPDDDGDDADDADASAEPPAEPAQGGLDDDARWWSDD